MDTPAGRPGDHPERQSLNAEMHARPPEALPPRTRITYMALTGDLSDAPMRRLATTFGVPTPPEGTSHFSADLGPFRMKWERHTEFVRYKFIVTAPPGSEPFAETALAAVPADWLAALPGTLIVANHVEIVSEDGAEADVDALAARHFDGSTLIGAEVAGGAGKAFADFRIRDDGYGRLLLFDRSMTPRQRGRTVQRLVEIETYCMMALLTLPVARGLMKRLGECEARLNGITTEMRDASKEDEPKLLDRMTLLHGDIVAEQTRSQFRMSAALAYRELVWLRIKELRERRIEGIQAFSEFMARRLDPAMRTCDAASARLSTLSESVAHATQLLQTRVDVTREEQNQALLESMDTRAKLQLRLQETVEGLSLAAITYYIVGLIAYGADGAKDMGLLPFTKASVVLAAIPVVFLLVMLAVRRARKRLHR